MQQERLLRLGLPKRQLHVNSTPRYIEGDMLPSGREIIQTIVDLIPTAKRSIDMQFYSFEAKDEGRRVLDACVSAKVVNPNLKIRIVIDNSVEYLHNGKIVGRDEEAKKNRDETNELLMKLKDDGILEDVKVTNWFSPKNKIANTLRLFSNILHRDHKKLFLIDARDLDNYPESQPKVIIGSANITNDHATLWKDGGRLFTDRDVAKVWADDFEDTEAHARKWKRVYDASSPSEYWEKYGKDLLRRGAFWELAKDGWASVVRNAERKGRRVIIAKDPEGRSERDQVAATDSFYVHKATGEVFSMVKKAKKGERVTVVTPYPGFYVLAHHLLVAAKKGVQVDLVIPQKNNHVLYNHDKIDALSIPKFLGPLDPLLRRGAHKNLDFWEKRLAKAGVDVYKYTGQKEGLHGMVHFKGATLERTDGSVRSANGSSNFSKGPFAGLNREDIIVTEGNAADDPLLQYIKELKADSVVIPGRRRGHMSQQSQ